MHVWAQAAGLGHPLYSGLLAVLQAEGGEWKPELLFMVPREHEEIQRLEGRYNK